MTLSFRARLTVRWVIGFGLVLALALAATYVGIRRSLYDDLDAQLRTLAGTELASAVDEPGMGIHLHELPDDTWTPSEYADKFVQLINDHGQVMMQSPVLGNHPALLTGDALRQALSGASLLVPVSVRGRPGRMTALRTAGPERYLVIVGLFTETLQATLQRLRWLLGAVWLSSLALTAALGFTLASRALGPIRRITTQAAAIARGEFDARLDRAPLDDEIGRMTRLLNEMLDRLHGAIDANRRFAADASHELRSPLTAMLGELDVTLKRDRSPEDYRETLVGLRKHLVEMSGLTEDLMLLVRGQERQDTSVVEVFVRPLLEAVVNRATSAARAQGATLRLDMQADVLVYGEPRLLERVFDNLIRNAIQHSPDGGAVTISAALVPKGGPGEWVTDDVLVRVCDHGAGIPHDARERVFDRFYRVDPSRSRRTGGSGLGLAISRDIVHLFHGSIRVAETTGTGTTIEVRLPGAASAARDLPA